MIALLLCWNYSKGVDHIELNNVTDLQSYKNDGIEIYIDTTTGESFCSLAGYARMAGVPYSTVKDRAQRGRFGVIEEVEVVTGTGLKLAKLIDETAIAKWLVLDNPVLAIELAKLGIRVFMHEIAGYKVTNTAVQPMSQLEVLALTVAEMAKLERNQLALAATQEDHAARLEAVEHHTTGQVGYMSLKAYVNVNNIEMAFRSYASVGKALVKLSKVIGYAVNKVADARYGQVNTYAVEVLDNYFTGE